VLYIGGFDREWIFVFICLLFGGDGERDEYFDQCWVVDVELVDGMCVGVGIVEGV